jgi:hypothetical protein
MLKNVIESRIIILIHVNAEITPGAIDVRLVDNSGEFAEPLAMAVFHHAGLLGVMIYCKCRVYYSKGNFPESKIRKRRKLRASFFSLRKHSAVAFSQKKL